MKKLNNNRLIQFNIGNTTMLMYKVYATVNL